MKSYVILSAVYSQFSQCTSAFFRMPKNLKKPHVPYWKDPTIHALGNDNWVHAILAPWFTLGIDIVAYDNKNLRLESLEYMNASFNPNTALDVGCGTGFSSRALQAHFDNMTQITAIDTSYAMISVAKSLSPERPLYNSIIYKRTNVHKELSNASVHYDLASFMFFFHEVPRDARLHVLRLAKARTNMTIIVDISPTYTPSDLMLAGEPHILDYKKNIVKDIADVFGSSHVLEVIVLENHVTAWICSRVESFEKKMDTRHENTIN